MLDITIMDKTMLKGLGIIANAATSWPGAKRSRKQ